MRHLPSTLPRDPVQSFTKSYKSHMNHHTMFAIFIHFEITVNIVGHQPNQNIITHSPCIMAFLYLKYINLSRKRIIDARYHKEKFNLSLL